MITTPEQMREAAARLADIAAKTLTKNAPMISRDTGVNQMFADLAATIRAIPIAPQPVALTAKPLVWDAIEQDRGDGSSDLTGDWTSETPFSAYSIVVGFGTDSYTFDVYYGEMGFVSSHDDPDTAKAAAQADYEARILSALTIQPADPLSDPRVVALVEALALAQYGLSWASAYFRDSNPPYCDDPCPPVNRGLDATRAALRAIGGES